MIKSTKSEELIGVANQKMIELLADNINSGNPSSMLKMVGTLLKSTPWVSFSESFWTLSGYLTRFFFYLKQLFHS